MYVKIIPFVTVDDKEYQYSKYIIYIHEKKTHALYIQIHIHKYMDSILIYNRESMLIVRCYGNGKTKKRAFAAPL